VYTSLHDGSAAGRRHARALCPPGAERCPVDGEPAGVFARLLSAVAAPDGSVLVTGRLGDEGQGLRMVDPVTGAVRTTVVAAAGVGDVSVVGGSALVAGGPTLYLFASVQDDDGTREVLAEVDVGSGRTVVDRDLDEDVAAASRYPVGRRSADDRRVRHPREHTQLLWFLGP
jgi:hypothetical protein